MLMEFDDSRHVISIPHTFGVPVQTSNVIPRMLAPAVAPVDDIIGIGEVIAPTLIPADALQ